MKKTGKFLFILPLLTAAVLLTAGEADERRLGDAAFFSGDYHTAVSFYESALKLASIEKDRQAWAKNALKLGRARFLDGDIAGARQILDEFRKREPLRSAGTLPGDLLAAEGKFRAAHELFAALQESDDPETVLNARFSDGCTWIREGNISKALECFSSLSADGNAGGAWQNNARREYIYSLIHLGKIKEAEAELQKITIRNNSLEILKLLAMVYAGDLPGFKASWKKILDKETPRRQPRISELLTVGAALAEKQKDAVFSVELLKRAEDFAVSEKSLRDIFRRQINLQSAYAPDQAADNAVRYSARFPAAPDLADVLCNIANLLAKNGRYGRSLQLYEKLINAKNVSLSDKLKAAAAGADTAELGREHKKAVGFFNFLVASTTDINNRIHWYEKFAEYLFRCGDFAATEKTLSTALKLCRENEHDRLSFLLLQTLVKLNKFSEIGKVAAVLAKSSVPEYASAGNYYLGQQAERSGDFSLARKKYLLAVKKGKKPSVPAFSAALMAYRMEDHQASAKEFSAFAAEYPKDPAAAEALFLAVNSLKKIDDEEGARKAVDILKKNYPVSEAYAVTLMQSASGRAADGDLTGAVEELAELENIFSANKRILTESMLMRSYLLKRRGDNERAYKTAAEIVEKYRDSAVAAESFVLIGNLLFEREKFAEASKAFASAAELAGSGVIYEIACGRIIDCGIAINGRSGNRALKDVIERCLKLVAQAKNPDIRLQTRYKLGMVLELSGDTDAAITAYEQLMYDAFAIKQSGISPKSEWCVRALESALRMISTELKRGSLSRGIRLIGNFEKLALNGTGINCEELRRELRKKFSNKR